MNDYDALPSSDEAESSVIATLMHTPGAMSLVCLSSSEFFFERNRAVYVAIAELNEQGNTYDGTSVSAKLNNEWSKYATDLASSDAAMFSTMDTLRNHAAIVADKALRRKMIENADKVRSMAFNCVDTSEIVSAGLASLAEVSESLQDEHREPLNLFSDHQYPTLKPEYLPPVIGRYCFDMAEVKGTAPELIALSSIATAAAAIHDGFRLYPKPGENWNERACLWFMAVADPSSKKTPAFNCAMEPLKEINERLCGEYRVKESQFKEADRLAKQMQRAMDKKRVKEGMGELTGYEEPSASAMPERPQNKRAIVNDITIEKLGEMLADNPRGLLMHRDEISVWLGKMDAYSKSPGGGAERGLWLEAYNGGQQVVDRMGRGTLVIPNWSVSVIGTTQPEKIAALIGKTADDGLWQRFITITVPNAYRPAQERPADNAAYAAYCETVRVLWSRLPNENGGNATVRLSPEANELRKTFFTWVERVASTDGLSPLLRGHLGKWTGLWSRLVLTYHCVGCASAKKWPGELPVSGATAQRVSDLMHKYLLPHAISFYNDTLGQADVVFSTAKQAASFILSKGIMRLTNRDLTHFYKNWREMPEWQKRAVVTLLVESGWLLGGDNQRKRDGIESAWTVNPRVHALFANRAQIESAKRSANLDGIRMLRDASRAAE